MTETDAADARTARFDEHARATLRSLADAFAEVVEGAAGGIPRPAELGRVLEIDRKLSWKITKVVQGRDPFSIVEHIPGAAGVEIFLTAALRCGAPRATVDTARRAYTSFEELIDVHAGDRRSLAMMARGFVDDASEQDALAHRRDAFLGNSFTWGVQARTQLSTIVMLPSADTGRVDVAFLSGLIDLRRLRPKVAWVVARLGFVGSPNEPGAPADGSNAVDPAAPRVPLLSEFCSDPLPQLRATVLPGGQVEVELDEGPVGDTGAMTCIFAGDVFRSAGDAHYTPEDPDVDLNVHVRTPARTLVHDLLVHRSLFGRLAPTASVYSEVHHDVRSGRTRDERYRLPIPLQVEPLGRGPSALRTPDVPRYPEMARHLVSDRLDHDPDDFDAYRIRLEFPVVPTAVTMSFPLPRRDA